MDWSDVLSSEKEKPYFKAILHFLALEKENGKKIYPESKNLFNAFKMTPYHKVKVVILGQDPYHGAGQAHGLSFSVQKGVKPPPSLMNIFKELQRDLGLPIPAHGCLEHWAQQGVLLLNTSLSVEAGLPQSHAKIGWSTFTDVVLQKLNKHASSLVFLLWGGHAKQKMQHLQNPAHLILTAPHPSPLSAHQGFLGCGHFSKANAFLLEQRKTSIDWSLP